MPAEIVASIGMGLVFVTVASTALVGVSERDAGVAGALVNTMQQICGAMGTALLNTIAGTATATYLATHHLTAASAARGLVHGYRTAFFIAAVLLIAGAVVAGVLVRAGREDLPAESGPVG